MMTLVWKARMHYYSRRDEDVFFSWLQSIPGVLKVQGRGTELFIRLRSKRLSATALRELLALYMRYDGNMRELAQFETSSNAAWFKNPKAYWYKGVFRGRDG
jgi:hypothetical protein